MMVSFFCVNTFLVRGYHTYHVQNHVTTTHHGQLCSYYTSSCITHYRNLVVWRVPRYTAKPILHTAKVLPCATYGKALTADRLAAKRALPCAFCRAHNKHLFHVFCPTRGQKKQRATRADGAWAVLPCASSAHGNISNFVVCHKSGTRQRMVTLPCAGL